MIIALECLDVATAGWLAQRDPALARLPEAVAAAEPGGKLHDVQWSPGRECRLAYEVQDALTQNSTYVAVTLDPSTWSHHDYRADAGLPGLRDASDPVLVSERLAAVVEEPILHCRVQPVRYRPGQRCVLRYDLRTASGTARHYAKVFASAVFADAAGRTARVTAAARPVGLRVGQVVAVWPDLHTTVASAVDGRSASTVLRDPAVSHQRRVDLAGDLGLLLADLHALAGVSVPTRTASDYLAEIADLLPSTRIVDAALADRLSRLIDRLDARLPLAEHREVLIHGAFRPGQVIVDDAGLLHLLDLDGVARGTAAQDLGSVSGHLSWQAIRQPSQELELRMIDQALRAGYRLRGPAVDPPTLAWWRAAALAQIGARRFRRLEVAHWALVPQLVELAESLLDGSHEGSTR